MALTIEQKNELDAKINDIMEQLANKNYFTTRDVCGLLGRDYHYSSILASLQRCCSKINGYAVKEYNHGWYSSSSPSKYMISRKVCKITDSIFRKEKNLLYLNNEYGNDVTYDFITHTFSIPDLVTNTKDNELSDYYRKVFSLKDGNVPIINKYEWLFNYCHNIREIYLIFDIEDFNHPKYATCPQGLVNYLNENNLEELTAELLREYHLRVTYGVFGYNLVTECDVYVSNVEFLFSNGLDKEFAKMSANSVKSGYFPRRNDIDDFIELWADVWNKYGETHIDTNKTFKANYELLIVIKNKEKNEALAKQLQQLNFINGYHDDKFIVVVPQNQAEKADEGKQQNNCVGYYYDDSILNGRDLIYFVRKIENPNHSYITCRYNIDSRDTVEHREVNNGDIKSIDARNFIRTVSAKIRQELPTEF